MILLILKDKGSCIEMNIQLYIKMLNTLNIEEQARLEILSQNKKDLQTQVARIKQTMEKVLDKDSLQEKEFVPYFVSRLLQ